MFQSLLKFRSKQLQSSKSPKNTLRSFGWSGIKFAQRNRQNVIKPVESFVNNRFCQAIGTLAEPQSSENNEKPIERFKNSKIKLRLKESLVKRIFRARRISGTKSVLAKPPLTHTEQIGKLSGAWKGRKVLKELKNPITSLMRVLDAGRPVAKWSSQLFFRRITYRRRLVDGAG